MPQRRYFDPSLFKHVIREGEAQKLVDSRQKFFQQKQHLLGTPLGCRLCSNDATCGAAYIEGRKPCPTGGEYLGGLCCYCAGCGRGFGLTTQWETPHLWTEELLDQWFEKLIVPSLG